MTSARSARYLQVYRHLRTAHLERVADEDQLEILFQEASYDFEPSGGILPSLRKASPWAAARHVFAGSHHVIEINEPLYTMALPLTAAVVAANRLRGIVRGNRATLVTYAIANLDPLDARPGDGSGMVARLSTRTRATLARELRRFVWSRVDLVVFGTAGAADTYRNALSGCPSRTQLIEALPAAVRQPRRESPPETMLFVGAFERRKGVLDLLRAWPLVVASNPGATLLIAGRGSLQRDVLELASEQPSITVLVEPVRADILRLYSMARVLILPSRRDGEWREQIGLPIVEALSYGCQVVTSDETGLAEWLQTRGHVVVPEPSLSPETLARAIREVINSPLTRREIIESLPDEDGRLQAARLMRNRSIND